MGRLPIPYLFEKRVYLPSSCFFPAGIDDRSQGSMREEVGRSETVGRWNGLDTVVSFYLFNRGQHVNSLLKAAQALIL